MAIAEWVQQDILSAASPPGGVIGSEKQLCARYGVGRTAFREAARVLQFRGVAQLRRGPGGGLVVGMPGQARLAGPLASLLHPGAATEQLGEARRALTSIASKLSLGPPDVTDETDTTPGPVAQSPAACPAGLAQLANASRNPAFISIAQTFETVCEFVRRPERHVDEPPGDDAPDFGTSRAASIARHIIAGIAANSLGDGARLGSEATICARYDVGPPVARQVIRLLEEAGIVTSQRGRGRGLFLRTPGTETVIAALASSLVTSGATTRESWTLGQLLNVEIVALAAASPLHPDNRRPLAGLLSQHAQTNAPSDVADILALDGTVDGCASNPILLAFLQSLKTYSRLRNRDRDVTLTHYANACGREFLESTQAVANAILSRDERAAGQAQAQKNEMFTRRVEQFA